MEKSHDVVMRTREQPQDQDQGKAFESKHAHEKSLPVGHARVRAVVMHAVRGGARVPSGEEVRRPQPAPVHAAPG